MGADGYGEAALNQQELLTWRRMGTYVLWNSRKKRQGPERTGHPANRRRRELLRSCALGAGQQLDVDLTPAAVVDQALQRVTQAIEVDLIEALQQLAVAT